MSEKDTQTKVNNRESLKLKGAKNSPDETIGGYERHNE